MKLLTHLIGLCALLLSGSVVGLYVPEVPKECVIILYGTHNWLLMTIGQFRMHRPVYKQILENGDFGRGTLQVVDKEFRWYMHADHELLGTSDALKDSDSSCPAALLPLYDKGVATHWIFDARPESMCVPQRQYVNTDGLWKWYEARSFDDCMHRAATDYPLSVVAQWAPSTTRCEIKSGSINSTEAVGTSDYRACMTDEPVRVPGIGEPRQGYRDESVFGVCYTRTGYAFDYEIDKVITQLHSWEECAVWVAEQWPDYLAAHYDVNTHSCSARKGALRSEGPAGVHVISCQMKVCDGSATMFEGGTFEVMHPTDNFDDCSKLVSGMRVDAVGAQWEQSGTKECRAIFGSSEQVSSTSWQSCQLGGCKQEGRWYKAPAVKPDVEARVKVNAPTDLSFEDCAKYVGQTFPWASVIDKDPAGECTAYFGRELTSGLDDSHTSCRTNLVRRRGPLKYEDRAWKEYDMGAAADLDSCISKAQEFHPEAMGVSFDRKSEKCVVVPLMAYADATSYETRTYWKSAFLPPKPMGYTTTTTRTPNIPTATTTTPGGGVPTNTTTTTDPTNTTTTTNLTNTIPTTTTKTAPFCVVPTTTTTTAGGVRDSAPPRSSSDNGNREESSAPSGAHVSSVYILIFLFTSISVEYFAHA